MQKKNWGEKMQDYKQTMGQIEEEIKKFRKLLDISRNSRWGTYQRVDQLHGQWMVTG